MEIKTETKIKIIPAYEHPGEVGALFTEYTDMLLAGDSSFQEYLDIQHYDEEIEHRGAAYSAYYRRCKGNRVFLHAAGYASISAAGNSHV